MSDCLHRQLVRAPVDGLMLATAGFFYFCTKCKAEFDAALHASKEAEELLRVSLARDVTPISEPAVPDHAAALAHAENRFSRAGLNFPEWQRKLREGALSEDAWRRTVAALGFEPGDVDQLVAAVLQDSEAPATE